MSVHCNCCTIALFSHLGYYFIKHTLHFRNRLFHLHSGQFLWRSLRLCQISQRSPKVEPLCTDSVIFLYNRLDTLHIANQQCQSKSTYLLLSIRFNGQFSTWTWVSRCLLKQRMMEVVVTTGAISHAKLQSHRHHQQTNIQLFTGWMPLLSSNQQCQSTEQTIYLLMLILTVS